MTQVQQRTCDETSPGYAASSADLAAPADTVARWRAGTRALSLLGVCLLACTACSAGNDVDPNEADSTQVGGADESGANVSTTNVTFPARGAFYYPWFPETWTVQGKHVSYQPKLGYYDSSATTAVDQHIAMMNYAKIQVAIASFWGPGTHQETVRIPRLLDRTKAAGSSLKWAFLYEKEGFGNPSPSTIASELDYLNSHYGSSSALARIGGKPVMFVYAADDTSCEVATRWSKVRSLLTKGDWYVNLKLFKGFESCTSKPSAWHQYGPNSPAQRHPGHSYVISPGFWRADQSSPALARDPARFRQNVKDMVASKEPWQLVTTFNEWGEGTAVEPASKWASSSGYGSYLDALHTDGQ
jgi:Glycosyl hydrolase family 99